MDEKMQETPEKQASAGLVEHLEPEVLRRNVSKVLEELDKNRFQNSPPARLVAVTKTVGPDVINQLKALNILDIGENRAQVALPKLPKIAPEFRLHWIGRLQTNKVKGIIDHVCMLHTLDRLALAQEAADAGNSSASTTEYHAERNAPFTYQEATFGISPSSTMLLLLPTAAARESL